MTNDLSAVLALCERQNVLIAQLQRELVTARSERDALMLALATMGWKRTERKRKYYSYVQKQCSCARWFQPTGPRDVHCPPCRDARAAVKALERRAARRMGAGV